MEYVTAEGGRVPNMGGKAVKGLSGEATKLAINFQATAADRPLFAVSKLTAAGHQVPFDKECGTSTHGATGRVTTFSRITGCTC